MSSRSAAVLSIAASFAIATCVATAVFAQEKGSGSGSGSGSGTGAKPNAGSGSGSGAGSGSGSETATKKAKKPTGSGSGAGTAAAPKGDKGPSSQAYNNANIAMHKEMDITFTGDSDVDFARGMIAHHKGAVAMAKVVLQYGRDPEMRKLAEEIVKAQETEITFMQGWLSSKGK